MPRGLARRCLDARIRGFAEFEGFCTDRFRPGTQSFKSAMFTNFITPARGRTRFYHCLPMRSLFRGAASRHPRIHPLSSTPPHRRQRFPPAPQHPRYNRIRVVRRPYPSDVCVVLLRNKRRLSHREVTNVFDNFPAENVYIASFHDLDHQGRRCPRGLLDRHRLARDQRPAYRQPRHAANDPHRDRHAAIPPERSAGNCAASARGSSASSCRRCRTPCSPTACKASTNSRPRPASS